LPNATISEVLSYDDPEPVESAPGWLLGTIRWRGWRLPLVAFAPLIGHEAEVGGLDHKVVVLKTLGGQPTMPYFALLSRVVLREVTVSRERLRALDAEDLQGRPGGRAVVVFNDEPAVIPDIDAIELSLRQARAA